MEDVEVVATLALSLVPGIGSQRLRTLIATFGSAQAALAAPQAKLAALYGIGPAAATAIKEARGDDGLRVLDSLKQLGARVLLAGDSDFPASLAEIPDPPAVLSAWGDITPPTRPRRAFVGHPATTEPRAAAA